MGAMTNKGSWLMRPRVIWLTAILQALANPMTAFVYYRLLLDTGTLNPDADSIGIPIFESVFASLVFLLPVTVALTFAILRKYQGWGTLLVWNITKKVRSWVATALLGLPAAGLLIREVFFILFRSENWFWFDFLWSLPVALTACWLLQLRAAAIAVEDEQTLMSNNFD